MRRITSLLVILLFSTAPLSAATPTRPNIVLIFADDKCEQRTY